MISALCRLRTNRTLRCMTSNGRSCLTITQAEEKLLVSSLTKMPSQLWSSTCLVHQEESQLTMAVNQLSCQSSRLRSMWATSWPGLLKTQPCQETRALSKAVWWRMLTTSTYKSTPLAGIRCIVLPHRTLMKAERKPCLHRWPRYQQTRRTANPKWMIRSHNTCSRLRWTRSR